MAVRMIQRVRGQWRQLVCSATTIRLLSSAVDGDPGTVMSYSAEEWWDTEQGPASGLHSMNTLRVPLITRTLCGERSEAISSPYLQPRPLEGFQILDVGCGGGILCEPLARLGAKVTGIEPGEENLSIARSHAHSDPEIRDHVTYLRTSVEELAEERGAEFDLVVASEVLEHVDRLNSFVQSHCALVKPGGHAVFTTINRTLSSYLVVIALAEWVAGALPVGTHNWEKFVTPRELRGMVRGCSLEVTFTRGMRFVYPMNRWEWTEDDSINYAIAAVKPEKPD